jgi:uncharacterized membrane protein
MFIVASVFSLLFFLFTGDFKNIPFKDLPFVYMATVFYILYQVFVAKSYISGNISSIYPLTVLSPIFIPAWAFLFLDEKLSLLKFVGILLTITGALVVKMKSFHTSEVRQLFYFGKDYKSAGFALLASFFYSFGAVFDKSRIANFDINLYICIILTFMSLNLLIFHNLFGKSKFKGVFRFNSIPVITGGLLVFLSFITFRIALREILVSIAVPARQISIVFAIMLGVFVLKEKLIFSRLIGSLIIIAGITLLNI